MTTAQSPRIRQVARAALAWASTHRADFALGEDALAADGQVNSSWKPLGELAQVCASVVHRTPPGDPLHTCAADLLAFAWQQTGEGGLFLRLQRLEPFATYPLEVYAALAAAGFRHPAYEAATATVARTRGWRLTEQEPTRRLGVLKAEEHGGVHRDDPGEQVLRRTWLGGLPEPWTFERSAGYALTHVVFHLTDWGRAPQGFPSDLTAYLAHWLPPWLDTCLDARMWDLSCELLAVAAGVPGLPDGTVPGDAWERIAAAQDPSGALPEENDAGDPDRYFAHHYHSTLMAAFAAALTAGQGAPV
ncbi:hypothetical protein AB0K68_33305 [Streptomyces sp. NPDC050698]